MGGTCLLAVALADVLLELLLLLLHEALQDARVHGIVAIKRLRIAPRLMSSPSSG